MTSPLDWHPAIRDILGSQEDVDPARVRTPVWIEYKESFTEMETAKPWEHYMPKGPGEGNWNQITLYRWRNVKGVGSFQLVRANILFYAGASGSGGDSASKQADLLINASTSIVGNINANQYLDPQMFNDVGVRFKNVWNYLVGNGQDQLNKVYKEIEAGGVAEGDAADAFAWAMHDMAFGMKMLADNIEGSGPTMNWAAKMHDTAAAVEAFKKEMTNAWAEFVKYQHHNPNTLVKVLLESMERQADTGWFSDTIASSETSGPQEPWYFDFGDILPPPARYDVMNAADWTRLNTDLKNGWITHWQDLDNRSQEATKKLTAAYDALLNALTRGVDPLPHTPYPGVQSPGEEGANPPPSTQGGSELPPPPETESGGSGNVPPDGGGGSNIPPLSESGGSNSNLPPGSGGPPPANSQVGGADFGGGPDSAGLDGSGSGSSGFGGSGGSNAPGLNGAGLNGPGVDGPGLGGSGSGGGGFVGAGGPGLGGAGVGSGGGGGRPGVGTGGGSDRPSPLDPNALGSGGSKGLDPDGLGASGSGTGSRGLDPGGFGSGSGFGSGLTPQTPSGFNLGPLGTPPPGYTPSPITNFPAAVVAGGASASGGENISGLPGAMAIPTPAPAPGGGPGAPGGMPFMPPMMGNPGGGKDNEKERERNTWLTEDEEVWGTDPDVTAAVIGRDDFEPEPDAQPTRRPAQPRRPQPTYEPARGRGN